MGTPESFIDLHPSGWGFSFAQGISPNGSQQVGGVTNGPVTGHAGLWNGTAVSWVDLHPTVAGATRSFANATTGTVQVGTTYFNQDGHAGLWRAAGSWVDLNPVGASASEGLAAAGNQQAGYAIIANVLHAGIWNGTAASWVDLHPLAPRLGSHHP